MDVNIKENFFKENLMDLDHFNGIMVKNMKVYGQRIKNMVRGNIFMLMVEFMKVIL